MPGLPPMELDRCARRPKDNCETLHILHGHDRIITAGGEQYVAIATSGTDAKGPRGAAIVAYKLPK